MHSVFRSFSTARRQFYHHKYFNLIGRSLAEKRRAGGRMSNGSERGKCLCKMKKKKLKLLF
jgi:hypothetical protein